jgi:hypothetical protein
VLDDAAYGASAHLRLVDRRDPAIEPWSVSGGYANYMQADEPLERVRAAFGPESFDRLRVVKSRYVPAGCAVRITRDRRGAGWIRARRKGAAWFGC